MATHCRLSSSEEFQQIVEDISGQDLDWFFDAYLKYKYPPVVGGINHPKSPNKTLFEWKTDSDQTFQMPLQTILGMVRLINVGHEIRERTGKYEQTNAFMIHKTGC